MWLLQTDPAYFHEHATYWKEYNISTLSGCKHTKAQKANYLAGRMMRGPITQAQGWDSLVKQIKEVKRKYQKNAAKIRPGHALPESYDRALGFLFFIVTNLLNYKAGALAELTCVSPA